MPVCSQGDEVVRAGIGWSLKLLPAARDAIGESDSSIFLTVSIVPKPVHESENEETGE